MLFTRQDKTRQDKLIMALVPLSIKKSLSRFLYSVFLIFVLFVQSLFPFGFLQAHPAFAYTTNMSASVVVGQSSFTTSTSGTTASTLNAPRGVAICDNKLVISDSTNNRVLVWNSIPTTSGQAADIVIGQPNFTSNTANNGGIGAATLNAPFGVGCAGSKLFIADMTNHRVLIYNSIPTTNGASANFVVGQPNLTSNTVNNGGIGANTLAAPGNVTSDGTKLFILDSGTNSGSDNNRRVLIFNTIPAANGVSADVVVGQSNFTTISADSCSASTFGAQPYGLFTNGHQLIVGDTFTTGSGNRVLIWNNVPTTNGVSADVVLGQPDFTTCAQNTGGISTNSLSQPFGVSVDNKGRLLIADRTNRRILIYNSVPSSNNASANLEIGQPNFTSSSVNQGQSSPGANTLSGARFVTVGDNQIIVSDGDNNRVLIFNNITNNPGLTLNNSPEGRDNGLIRLKGTSTIPSTSSYTISSVQYSVNGGGFNGATATDGSFSSTSEEFYFDFDPKSNQQRDNSGNLIDGYTVGVKSINTNLDETDHLFYFQPFNLNEPLDNAITTSVYPSFDFSVIKQKNILKDNLSKYQIQVRSGGSDSTASWRTIIDDIPINGTLDNTNTVVADNDKLKVVYTDDSSRIKVYSKINPLAGTIQWKVVAVDKTGHTEDSGARSLRVNSGTNITNNFPLAILNISGLGNPNISTNNISAIKDTYYISSLNPIFYGIAFVNAKVILNLTDQGCDTTKSTDCTKTYSTIANPQSRFGINIQKGDLAWNKKYTANMSVAYNQDYNELPQFTLSTSGNTVPSTSGPSSTQQSSSADSTQPTSSPTIAPTPQPTPTSTPATGTPQTPATNAKHCFLFICL